MSGIRELLPNWVKTSQHWRQARLVLLILMTTGCTTQLGGQKHPNLDTGKQLSWPARIAILEADIQVKELGVNLLEKVPSWSAEGRLNVDRAVNKILPFRLNQSTLVALPTLTPEQQFLLDEHIALYHRVAANDLAIRKMDVFIEERKRADDTLGDGLAFLARDLGLDGIVLITGEDLISSGGRKFTAYLAAAGGVAIPLGRCYLNIGLVDLKSGQILWSNTAVSIVDSFRDADEAASLVVKALEGLATP